MKIQPKPFFLFFLLIGILIGFGVFYAYDISTNDVEKQITPQKQYPAFVISFPYLDYHIHPEMLEKEIECRKAYLDHYHGYLLSWQDNYASDALPVMIAYEPCIDLSAAAQKYDQYYSEKHNLIGDLSKPTYHIEP